MVTDAFIIIRAAGERTEVLCKKLIIEQGFTDEDVVLIRENPFSEALLKSFDLGMEQEKKWTFCVDADVLLRPGSIQEMIRLADAQPQQVCQVQSYMLDKFFGGVRKGGVHLYRTSLLEKVKEKVPEEGTDIRPESFALRQMADEGFPTKVVPYVVGLHDFEQYNYDIYRKAFVQAEKHLFRAELFIKLWKARAEDDPDYKAALQGFADSITNRNEIYINRNQPLYKELFEVTGIQEKEEVTLKRHTPEWVENTIMQWNYPDIYHSYFPDKDGYELTSASYWNKVKRAREKYGLLKTARYSISELLFMMSKKLK
jgi:hypothetical protein